MNHFDEIIRLIGLWTTWLVTYLFSSGMVQLLHKIDVFVSIVFGVAGLIYTVLKIIEMVTDRQLFPNSEYDD